MYGEESGYVDGEPARHNSYQWDFVMDDGDFFKGGYGGQGLYISPSRDLVVAFFGTFDENHKGQEMTRIARQLAKSGLFN
jgi:CubicO group peptidase (beta-lactamase class C family)